VLTGGNTDHYTISDSKTKSKVLWQFFDVKFIYTSHIRFVFTRYQNLASKEKLPL